MMTAAIEASLILPVLLGRYNVTKRLPEEGLTFASNKMPVGSYAKVIDWLMGKLSMTRNQFDLLIDPWKTKAFTIAREQDLTVIEQAKQSLEKAIVKGQTYESWRDKVVKDGGTFINDGHAETVYRTNLFSSYSASQKQTVEDPSVRHMVWGYRYHTLEDDRVRPTHQAMNQVTKPKEWDGWSTWYPPNGYNCRCFVEVLTTFEAELEGVVEADPPSKVTDEEGNELEFKPDKDFESAPDT